MTRKDVYLFFLFFILFIIIFHIIYIFDYRQKDIRENQNDYNYNLDLEIPNKAIFPRKDIYNTFLLYDNNNYIDGNVYPLLSDSTLLTRIIGKGNNSYICELGSNNEVGSLLGCYVIWSSTKSNNSKTVKITMLKENKSIILFQENNTYKELNNEFSQSYIILNDTKINREKIIIETFMKDVKEAIQIYEFYLLVISDNDLYPKVVINQLELVFFLNFDFYNDYNRIVKIFLFITCVIIYTRFYFKKNSQFFMI